MMDPQARQDCLKEVKILQNLEHRNIVKCFDSFIQVMTTGDDNSAPFSADRSMCLPLFPAAYFSHLIEACISSSDSGE